MKTWSHTLPASNTHQRSIRHTFTVLGRGQRTKPPFTAAAVFNGQGKGSCNKSALLLRNLPAANPVNTTTSHRACGESPSISLQARQAAQTQATHTHRPRSCKRPETSQASRCYVCHMECGAQRTINTHKGTLLLLHGVPQTQYHASQTRYMHNGLHLLMHSGKTLCQASWQQHANHTKGWPPANGTPG